MLLVYYENSEKKIDFFFCQFYFERQWKFEVEMLGGCAKMNHDANFFFFGQCDSLVDGNNTRKKRKSENNVK